MRQRTLFEFAPALALVALGSCGASNRSSNETNGGTVVEKATLAKLTLSSDAFHDGQAIPAQYSCDGANRSPALKWGEPPAGTKSFALVIDDPDAPSGTFRHWDAYDIPASTRSIASGQHVGTEVNNDKGTQGYTGPCPPRGHGTHHYHFRLFALDVERLSIGPNSKVADVESEATKHALAEGGLVGTFERR